MQSATILPTHYLHLIKDEPYHMCLAHLIGKDPEYTHFYNQIGKNKQKYLIMDNGVIEGDQRPVHELVKKAIFIGADELILPDVFENSAATLDASYRALRYVQDAAPNLKLMAVPQGKNMDEWLECAIIMIDWDIHCLGIPKVLVKSEGPDARLHALTYLGNKTRGLDIHLLGCWQTPLEISLIERASLNKEISSIRGVDSAIAWVYSKAGIFLNESDRPQINHIDFLDIDTNEELLSHNIRLWKAACDFNITSPHLQNFDE
jgi:hypothetical protein